MFLDLSLIEGAFYSFFAFLVGIIAAALGVGGGFISTPALIILIPECAIEPATAVGTMLLVIIFTALSSTLAYAQQNMIEYRTGVLIAGFTVIGALLGSFLSSNMDPTIFRYVFAICLFPIAVKMILYPKRRSQADIDDQIEHDQVIFANYEKREWLSAVLGLTAGFLSGLLGIGGGVIMVPILVHVGKLPMHRAVATSMFIMIATSIAGVAIKINFDHVYYDLALFLIIGIIIGAQIGARTVKKIDSVRLQQIFGIAMIIALIYISIGKESIADLINML